MPHVNLEFTGFDEVLKKLAKLGADTEKIAEEALIETHKIITAKAEAAVAKSNLPAHGKYSFGDTEKSIKRDPDITWKGTEGSVAVGYNIKKGGLPSIFMMYGSPRYMKVQAVYDAFYGDQTIGEVRNAQQEIFYKALEEFGG